MNREDLSEMDTFKVCKRSTCITIFLVIFLSVIIVSSQAMTISRDELSQLFDGFLDKLEQQSGENSAEVKESPRQVDPQIVDDAEENRSKLSQRLASILHELNEEESDTDTMIRPSTSEYEQDQTADAVLIELLNESRNMAHHENETMQSDSDDDVAGDSNENENESELYDFATCELRLNERLEPMTLAKYHGLRGTINFRQNRSDGSLEVLIRLFGLIPSNMESQGHGIYIREFGDLRDGCHRLGPIINSDSDTDEPNRSSGLLAVISPDGSGYAQYRSTEVAHIDLAGSNSVYGRSIVIEENQNTFSAPLGCCVIGVTRDVGDWM